MKKLSIVIVAVLIFAIAVTAAMAETLTLTLRAGDVGQIVCQGQRLRLRRINGTQYEARCIGDPATPTESLPTNTPTATATLNPPTNTPMPPTVTPGPPTPTNTPGAPTGRLTGILAAPSSNYEQAFQTMAGWGSNTTSLQGPVSAAELQAAVDAANSAGLGLIGRASSGSFISGGSIDLDALTSLIQNQFGGTDLAGQLAGYYLIDEPCHPKNSGITPQQMVNFYRTIKAEEADLQVLVNYSYAGCLEEMTSLGQTADIGAVCRNVSRPAGYWAEQAATVARVKEQYPGMVILAWSAVYEYPSHGVPIPSPDWVRTTGIEAAGYDAFDGVMYFSWSPSSYMGDTIEDVTDNPAYVSAFTDVFNAAR